MGWTTITGSTKQSIIAELTKTWNCKDRKLGHNQEGLQQTSYITYFNAERIKHCYRGNAYSGVLWVVWEWKIYDIHTDEHLKTERWLGCYLMRYDKSCSGWGYKDMEESSHPFYYSCPLGYLDIVPKVTNEKWRKKVREYHEIRNRKYKIDDILKLHSNLVPHATVCSTRPLRGVYQGRQYRIPLSMIDRVLTQEQIDELDKIMTV